MTFLHDSKGKHIANLVGDHLHSPSGANIGHHLPEYGIFIDRAGRYLGAIVAGNRLLSNRRSPHRSPHRSTNFGNRGNAGNAGNFGNPGNRGNIGAQSGYEDIDPAKLL